MTIQFMNHTTNATSYSWDFGDGTTSGVENPEHIYQQSGTYGVKLTATNEANERSVIKSVVITEPTVLGFVVTESTGQYALPYASVWVYDNKADWDAFVDPPQFEAYTDEDGIAVFLNMEPVEYYYFVFLEDVDGFWGDAGYISPIDQNEINGFLIYCEWYSYALKGASPFSYLKQLTDH